MWPPFLLFGVLTGQLWGCSDESQTSPRKELTLLVVGISIPTVSAVRVCDLRPLPVQDSLSQANPPWLGIEACKQRWAFRGWEGTGGPGWQALAV